MGDFKEIVFNVLWLIWYGRNLFLFERSPQSASGIVDKAERVLAEFNAASSASIAPLKMYRSLWVAPSPHPHQFKVNFNAAMTPGSEGIGISVVIRRAR